MPDAPLTDPGEQYSRTGLFNLTRSLSPAGRFASVAPSISRNWLPVWTSSGCQPLGPSRGLRLAMAYYELIRLPGLPLPLLLVVEAAYPLGSRSSCGGTVRGLLGFVRRLPRAPRSQTPASFPRPHLKRTFRFWVPVSRHRPRLRLVLSRLNRLSRMRVPLAARAFPWVRFSTVVRPGETTGPPVLLPPSNPRSWAVG